MNSPIARVGLVTSPPGGTERLFGVGRMELDGDGRVAHGEMVTGPWMRAVDGTTTPGSLGILIDDATGAPLVGHRAPGHWPVTTELSVSFGAEPPCDGSLLRARATSVSTTSGGGLGSAEVLDIDGNVIATGTGRFRYIAVGPDFLPTEPDLPDPAVSSEPTSTWALLNASTHQNGSGLSLAVPIAPELANPLGVLHGGIAFCASEIAGSLALRTENPSLRTASLHIVYARPTPAPGTVLFTTEVLHCGRTLGMVRILGTSGGKTCTIATLVAHDPDLADA